MQRRRSAAVVAAGTAAFAALALTGCGRDADPDHQGVCVDRTTERRVDDRDCDGSGGGHGARWVFWPIGARFPGMGQSVRAYPGGTTSLPSGSNGVLGGAAASGGTVTTTGVKSAVSRGGFGTTGRAGGGNVGG